LSTDSMPSPKLMQSEVLNLMS